MDTVIGPTRRQVLAGVGAALAGAAPAAAVGEPVVALTGVTVIDMIGTRPRRNMTVLVAGGRITALGRRTDVPIPPGTRSVDLAGKFLIPGLCDMHVHSIHPEGILPQLYVATGVTTVREMADFPWVREWRERVTAGELLGPRWVIGSRILDGTPSIWTGSELGVHIEISDARQAREAVRQARRDGADFVKVYSRLDRESLFAVAAEARRQGLPFAGHAADAVSVVAAARSGQRSFEHFFPALLGTSLRQAEVRRMLASIRLTGTGNGAREWFRAIHPIDWFATNTHDRHRAAEVYAELRDARAAVTPTMLMHHITDLPDEVDTDPERLKYLPPGTLGNWRRQLAETFTDGRTPTEITQHRSVFRHRLRMLGEMRDAGVRILAGTDAAGVMFAYPGFALHDELALLVRAGFTPLEALRAATREPARYLGLQDSLGTIRTGNLADLVVLDANPLDDIRNTRRIHAVVLRGRYISAAERQRLLADIEAVARSTAGLPTAGCCGAQA